MLFRSNKTIEVKQSDKLSTIYSNNIAINTTLFDCCLRFGQTIEITNDKVVIEPLVNVYVSPQHMKTLSNVLIQNILNYEKLFGEIKLPVIVDGVVLPIK